MRFAKTDCSPGQDQRYLALIRLLSRTIAILQAEIAPVQRNVVVLLRNIATAQRNIATLQSKSLIDLCTMTTLQRSIIALIAKTYVLSSNQIGNLWVAYGAAINPMRSRPSPTAAFHAASRVHAPAD